MSAGTVVGQPRSRRGGRWRGIAGAFSLRRGAVSGMVIVVLVALWQIVVTAGHVKSYLLPAPSRIASVMVQQRGVLWRDSVVTLEEVLIGYAVAAVLGIAAAVLIAKSALLRSVLAPLLVAMQVVPKIAIAPLFVVWFGFGIEAKILMTILITFFPIVADTLTGLLSEPLERRDLSAVMGLTAWTRFRRVEMPGALPSMFAGLKVGLTLAVIGAIVAEFVGANAGLGYLMQLANGNLDTALIFAGLVVITAWGMLLYGLLSVVETFAMPWHVSRRSREGTTARG